MKKQCPFCHRMIWFWHFESHCAHHARLRPDGQQTDHYSLKPKDRYTGDLKGVPRVYVHLRCGRATGMPEHIIRSYLVDPFLYNSKTFCGGCHTYVPHRECVWRETGENLEDYMNRLKLEVKQLNNLIS